MVPLLNAKCAAFAIHVRYRSGVTQREQNVCAVVVGQRGCQALLAEPNHTAANPRTVHEMRQYVKPAERLRARYASRVTTLGESRYRRGGAAGEGANAPGRMS